jgi:hypothetical protein
MIYENYTKIASKFYDKGGPTGPVAPLKLTKVRSQWHYRNNPLRITASSTAPHLVDFVFSNIMEASFYLQCTIHHLHKAIVRAAPLWGPYDDTYCEYCEYINKRKLPQDSPHVEKQGPHDQGTIPGDAPGGSKRRKVTED